MGIVTRSRKRREKWEEKGRTCCREKYRCENETERYRDTNRS